MLTLSERLARGFAFGVFFDLMRALTAVLLVWTASSWLHGQINEGVICVAPNSAETPQRCAPGLCESGELSFKIDRSPIQAWPKAKSIKLSGLEADKHRVVITARRKPSSRSRFAFPTSSRLSFASS